MAVPALIRMAMQAVRRRFFQPPAPFLPRLKRAPEGREDSNGSVSKRLFLNFRVMTTSLVQNWVGGGLIKVPAVVVLGAVPMSIAVGSSSLMVGVSASTGLVGHLLRGHIDLILTGVLAAGVLIGSQIGPRFAIRSNQVALKKYFALLLVAISIWLIQGVIR